MPHYNYWRIFDDKRRGSRSKAPDPVPDGATLRPVTRYGGGVADVLCGACHTATPAPTPGEKWRRHDHSLNVDRP